MAVKFGVFVPQGWRMDLVQIKDPIEKYEAMTRMAQAADRGPWDAIWVYDHFHTVPEPTPETTFECWTITSTLVRDTKRVRVGQDLTRGTNPFRRSPFHEALEILGAVLAGEMDGPIREGLAGFFVAAEGVVLANFPIRVRAVQVGIERRD